MLTRHPTLPNGDLMSVHDIDPWLWRRFSMITSGHADAVAVDVTEDVESGPAAELPTDESALDDTTRRTMIQYAEAVDSTSLIVLVNGSVAIEWYPPGRARETMSGSQSMHKSLLPFLVLAAIDAGLLPGLDSPIAPWMPEWADDPRGDIRIEELMRMSSGLRVAAFTMNPLSWDFAWLFSGDTAGMLRHVRQASGPNQEFAYNNINSHALGMILSRATGVRYATWLRDRLWAPAGAGPAQVWLDSPGGQASTSCCLQSTAYGWARFGELIGNRGEIAGERVVPAEWVDSVTAADPRWPWYGRQIWLADGLEHFGDSSEVGRLAAAEPFDARGVVIAQGFGGQRVYVAPQERVVVVRMGPANGTPDFTNRWDNTRLLNMATRGLT